MEQKYTPQGHASPSGILITFILGILASLLLPLFYIVLARLIPNIWFIAICALLLGLGLGFFVDFGIKTGKVRNLKVAVIVATFCGLLAFYTQWVFFDAIMYSRKGFSFNQSGADISQLMSDIFFLFTHPVTLFKEIVALNAVGTFRIESTDAISGVLLWLIWAGEFLVIVGSTIIVVANGQVKKPYSELNDEWMILRKNFNCIPFVNDKINLLQQIQNRNFDVLRNDPTVLGQPDYAEVLVYESNGDPTKFISVLNVNNPSDKKKNVKKKKVLSHFPIRDLNI